MIVKLSSALSSHFHMNVIQLKNNDDNTNQYQFKGFIMPSMHPKIRNENEDGNHDCTDIENLLSATKNSDNNTNC